MLASIAVRTRRLLNYLGIRTGDVPDGLTLPFWCAEMARRHERIYRAVRPYTMTVVECGVWRGGSMMAAAFSLLHLESTTRQLYLFDTYTGMPEPRPFDRDRDGRPASDWLRDPTAAGDMVRACCDLQTVRQAMLRTRYPWKKIVFVPGRVEEVLPAEAPAKIALLRLDTDWYESTYHELEHLWPRLALGGVLIVDDYGHWQGARRAVDEYFARHRLTLPLHTIDYTGRLVVKTTR